jgi:3-phosphoshikimate 1-carboxyvinyltransferase
VVQGKITGGEVAISGFNSQFVSALLLACPLARNDTIIRVENPLEKPYIQMTIDWMKRCGVHLAENSGDYTYFKVRGGQHYQAFDAAIPADWSGAAFPLVAAVCTPSALVISGLDFSDAQGDKAVVDMLIALGADITKEPEKTRLIVRGGKPLQSGISIDLTDTPDALPALSVAAAYAQGSTVFTGLAHIRVKETDRVAVMEEELSKLGVEVQTTADTMTISGGNPLRGTILNSHGDHRVAMALAAAGLFAQGQTRIQDTACVSVSFPNFFDLFTPARPAQTPPAGRIVPAVPPA